ncbi:MAG: radical SAM family heme chaperone HemW [Chitinophagales bacterium]
MAGIYIHIPFCKQACHYCDFHFSVKQEMKAQMVAAILKETILQSKYLNGESISTIYLGGGTPSLLPQKELASIFDQLYRHFNIDPKAEVTLEANPDDLTEEKISGLIQLPINRLSIGIQSFSDADLKWMNRAHNSLQAIQSVKASQDAGFKNISIDLMYGLPESTSTQWNENLTKAFALNVQHLSCYCLTIEPRTALAHFISSGKTKPVDEEQSAQQFEKLQEQVKEHEWKQYEISNFACDESHVSQHNTSYWQGKKYLGLGPSAHSFDGTSRQWNISNNHQYIAAIENGNCPMEKEVLTPVQRMNERIMTELRTMWGLRISDFEVEVADVLRGSSSQFLDSGLAEMNNDILILTDKGKLIADRIILELMVEEKAK